MSTLLQLNDQLEYVFINFQKFILDDCLKHFVCMCLQWSLAASTLKLVIVLQFFIINSVFTDFGYICPDIKMIGLTNKSTVYSFAILTEVKTFWCALVKYLCAFSALMLLVGR